MAFWLLGRPHDTGKFLAFVLHVSRAVVDVSRAVSGFVFISIDFLRPGWQGRGGKEGGGGGSRYCFREEEDITTTRRFVCFCDLKRVSDPSLSIVWRNKPPGVVTTYR